MIHLSVPRALRLSLLLMLVIGVILVTRSALMARATVITVNTTADELNTNGNCSLREAIRAANLDQAVDACPAGNGSDRINLPAGTYILTLAGTNEDAAQTGDLDVTADLIIVGAGRTNTAIDGNGLDRVFHILTGTVALRDFKITGGFSGGSTGGGIRLEQVGNLTLDGVRVTGNGGNVGGIDATSGTLTVVGSRIDGNAGASAAGLQILSGGVAIISNSEISDNASSTTNGGVSNGGTLTLINSTVSGNHAQQNVGGIGTYSVAGTTSLYNVTLANNTADFDGNGSGVGGGVYNAAGVTFSAYNTLIGDNSGASSNDCFSADPIPVAQFNFNLLEDTTGCTFTSSGSINIFGQDPRLDPLAFNGGGVQTQALRSNSPAIDAGGPLQCRDDHNSLLTIDERGYARPIDGDGDGQAICDMGAYEYNSPGTPTPTNTATPTRTSTPTRTATPTRTPTSTRTPTVTPTCIPGPDFGCAPTATATPFAPSHWVYLPVIQK